MFNAQGRILRKVSYVMGVKVPVTKNGALLAEWAQTKRTRTAVPENKRDTASIGYDHFLSKRTDVYAIYSYDKQTGYESADTIGFGIRHTF